MHGAWGNAYEEELVLAFEDDHLHLLGFEDADHIVFLHFEFVFHPARVSPLE